MYCIFQRMHTLREIAPFAFLFRSTAVKLVFPEYQCAWVYLIADVDDVPSPLSGSNPILGSHFYYCSSHAYGT